MREIFAAGGDSKHFPTHNIDSCIASWVAGADWIHLRVQMSIDEVLILFPTNELGSLSNVDANISEMEWHNLRQTDSGHIFQVGNDFPWRRVREPFERDPSRPRHRSALLRLDNLLRHLPETCGIVLSLGGTQKQFNRMFENVLRLIEGSDTQRIIIATDKADQIRILNENSPDWVKIGYELAPSRKLSDAKLDHDFEIPSYVFCDSSSIDEIPPNKMIVARVNEVEDLSDLPPKISVEATSSLEIGDRLHGCRQIFSENFAGESLDRSLWMSGISGGFETPARMMWNPETGKRFANDSREIFDTRLIVKDALIFDIHEGDHYASAAIVSRFPVGGDFWIEVDWTYRNPERATMMLLGLTNTDVFSSHRPTYGNSGEVVRPTWQDEHQIFDTHGNPPFVSMEHEENDGTRIICNRVGTGFYRWYNNFYQPNIGDGLATEGRFRLMRRGRYFAAYLKDPANKNWVGVGALENDSMNDRLYIRMGAKHYPKRGAPEPLPSNYVTFENFKIFKRDRNS